jgi:hypothetical protein
MNTTKRSRVFYFVLLGGMLAAVLLGCATPHTTSSTGYTGFLVFEGKQSNWPQAPSVLTKMDFAVPAYLGLPPKSYRVIGLIVNDEPEISGKGLPSWLWTNDSTLLRALNVQEGPGIRSSRLLTNSDGVIVAIQWADRSF